MKVEPCLRLSEEALHAHLQVIAHSTHVQLDTACTLLGGDPDAVLEVLEIIAGTHILTRATDQEDIERALDVFRDNVLSFVAMLRRAAAAEAARRRPAANDNDNDNHQHDHADERS